MLLTIATCLLFSLVSADPPQISKYGIIFLPGMGVRVSDNEFQARIKGRISSAIDTVANQLWIDYTQQAIVPELFDDSNNQVVRDSYFSTFAHNNVPVSIQFQNGTELNPVIERTLSDGVFNSIKTIQTAQGSDTKLVYQISNIDLFSYTILAEQEGFAIVTDIDDTIRLSGVAWLPTLYKKSFKDTFEATKTMPEFFASLQQNLHIVDSSGRNCAPTFHYLSGSPQQFAPVLQPWLEKVFPPGEMVLPPLSMSHFGPFGLMKYQSFKVNSANEIISMFPKRKLILIGDSTQFDAEAYATVYLKNPEKIQCIFIRLSVGFNKQ